MKNYELIEDMFPNYLKKTDIRVLEDKITINFKCNRKALVFIHDIGKI